MFSSLTYYHLNPIPGGLSEPHFGVGGGGKTAPLPPPPPYLNFCLRTAIDMKLCTG